MLDFIKALSLGGYIQATDEEIFNGHVNIVRERLLKLRMNELLLF